MVNTEKDRGGAARMAFLLAETIQEDFKDVAVSFYHTQNRDRSAPAIGLKKRGSRQTNALVSRFLGAVSNVDFGLSNQIIEMTRNDDLLHLHNLHGYYLDWRSLLRGWGDRPIVWTWHDQWGATGRCGFPIECPKWETGCEVCSNKNYYPASWIDRAKYEYQVKTETLVSNKNIWVVSPSSWLCDVAIQRGYDSARVLEIPNPVKVMDF